MRQNRKEPPKLGERWDPAPGVETWLTF